MGNSDGGNHHFARGTHPLVVQVRRVVDRDRDAFPAALRRRLHVRERERAAAARNLGEGAGDDALPAARAGERAEASAGAGVERGHERVAV